MSPHLGNARIAGLEKNLGLQEHDFNIALTCYAIAYALFQIPGVQLCRWIGPGWFLPSCVTGFGFASLMTAFVQNRGQLFLVRSLLGVFGSCTFPGVAYYLCRWYRRAELVFRISLLIVAVPTAGACGGLLAWAILQMPDFDIFHGWKKIFLIEGVISAGLGMAGYLVLTDRPSTALWLTPEERRLVERRVLSERPGTDEHLDNMDLVKFWRAIKNPVVWATAWLFFLSSYTAQAFAYFLPTIMHTIYPGKTEVAIQLYTIPPHAVGIVITVAISGLSWWLDRRQIILTICSLPVLLAYVLFMSTHEKAARYAAACLVGGFCHLPACLTCAQINANVISDASKSVAMSINTTFAALAVSLLHTFLVFLV